MQEIRPNRIKDISGSRFGSLTVVCMNGRITTPCGSIKTTYECVCDCGNRITTKRSNLVNGYTKSCGCLITEVLIKRNTTHGLSRSRAYKSWTNLIQRCTNKNNTKWSDYGGRGISVCDRWLASFENFFEDMGECKYPLEIDRINNEGNYEPGNCRWATRKEQANNTRFSVHITFNGETNSLTDWARIAGVTVSTMHTRLKNKWPLERAFSAKKILES